ncbi:MAG TPA: hypothetical protein DD734_03375 [Firmicutes bacterium]|nr:hypothetical protein [Bacillota bacterium]
MPFAGLMLITGGGLLWRQKWAWYLVQIFWVFLLCTGALLLIGFNFILFRCGSGVEGTKLCLYGNLGLGLLLGLIPLGGLAFFAHAQKEFRSEAPETNPWTVSSDASEKRQPWG